MDKRLLWFETACLILSVIFGANSNLAFSQSQQQPPPQNQLQTLSCPYGYYLATNYLCYPLQSRPTNATQPPSLSSSVTNFGSPTQIINGVKPGLPILPLTIKDDNHALVGNIIFFINSTDGDYHLKGVKRNVLPETVDIPSVMVFFNDQTSGRIIDSASDSSPSNRVAPGGSQHWDIDTGYNVTRAEKEFKYMNGQIIGP
jgi:hypothetical protein